MTTGLARIAARLYDQPLLLLEDAAITIANVLADRLGSAFIDVDAGTELRAFHSRALARSFDDDEDGDGASSPYSLSNGMAVIPVRGELINRGSWLSSVSGLTSYEALGTALKAARADPSAQGIILDVDSPGGEAANAIETGQLVREVAQQKPVVAFVNSLAASAGYAIAAGATRIIAIPSASLGSIGVLRIHRDATGAYAKAGIKPTIIRSAEYKAEGSSLEPLNDAVLQRARAQLSELHDFFAGHVAAMRNISVDQVNATKGAVLFGSKAIETGLADELGGLDDVFAYLNRGQMRPPIFRGTEMADQPSETNAQVSPSPEAIANASKAAVDGERARAKAIMSSPEAEGRSDLAQYFAYETDMSAEAAVAALKRAPKAEAKAPQAESSTAAPGRLVVPQPDIQPEENKAPVTSGAMPWDKIAAQLNTEAADSNIKFTSPGSRATH